MNRPVRRLATGLACAALVATTACTNSGSNKPRTPAGGPTQSVTSSATISARPVPLKVLVTRVSGKLSTKARGSLEHNVGKAIGTYFDAAFLGGSYPRTDFHSAFASFPKNLAHQAYGHRFLLSNATYGPTTTRVVTKRQSAYLSVLAPYKVAAGVSARVDLVFVDQRGAKPAKRVHLAGRLMLTRRKRGGWKVFGYHVARSVSTVKGS